MQHRKHLDEQVQAYLHALKRRDRMTMGVMVLIAASSLAGYASTALLPIPSSVFGYLLAAFPLPFFFRGLAFNGLYRRYLSGVSPERVEDIPSLLELACKVSELRPGSFWVERQILESINDFIRRQNVTDHVNGEDAMPLEIREVLQESLQIPVPKGRAFVHRQEYVNLMRAYLDREK